jgi:hypothetical protein
VKNLHKDDHVFEHQQHHLQTIPSNQSKDSHFDSQPMGIVGLQHWYQYKESS